MKKQKTLLTYEDVKEKALRLLEFRSHSEKELAYKLRHYEASEENIERALDFCRRYGFVNDEHYAHRKAHDLMYLKKYGSRRIRTELKMKGISDEFINSALSSLDNDFQQQTLFNLVEKKLKGDFSQKNTGKCIRYFMYRGYDLYDIKDAIRQLEDYNDL